MAETKVKECEFRIVLLGKRDEAKTRLGNIITSKQGGHSWKQPLECVVTGEWRGKSVAVVKAPNIFRLSMPELEDELTKCITLCSPGPNVLLLIVKASSFSEIKRERFISVLSLFGLGEAFKHSLIISTHEMVKTETMSQLLSECGGRYYSMLEGDQRRLMKKITNIVRQTNGAFLTVKTPVLNLVLYGARDKEKTSAAEAILGQTGLHSASRSSECVQHQGKVCGHWVSLVDLPALSGKPLETVMKESLRSVSLCDPEGVHAFILVLPVGPLTDEDKGELKIIQETFSSHINDFTMILFITESHPKDPAVVHFVEGNKAIQKLVKSFGRGHFVLNIKDQQQIPELLDAVGSMWPCTSATYTLETFTTTHTDPEDLDSISFDDVTRRSDRLRIVLIGKTGSGKSSSGNTILGRKEFKAEAGQISVTRDCQKAYGEVDSRPVAVVDTPGLFDTSLSKEEILERLKKCFSLLAPGPHVFLLVLQVGRLTEEEEAALKVIKEGLGMNVEPYTVILFTRGDTLEYEERSIEDYVKEKCGDSFKKLLNECGNRYHVFNNYNKQNRQQVSELIAKIDTMVEKNEGVCYTNKILQEADNKIKKEVQKILKDKAREMQEKWRPVQREYEEEMRKLRERFKKEREEARTKEELNARKLQIAEEIMNDEHRMREEEKEKMQDEDRKLNELKEIEIKEWENKLRVLEEKIQENPASDEDKRAELEQIREEMRKEQEAWENKHGEKCEKLNRDREDREKQFEMKLRDFQRAYVQEKERHESEMEKEEQERRKQEEESIKELEMKHKKKMDEIKRPYEEEARKKAEEFNEFAVQNIDYFADQIRKEMVENEQQKQMKKLMDHMLSEKNTGDKTTTKDAKGREITCVIL